MYNNISKPVDFDGNKLYAVASLLDFHDKKLKGTYQVNVGIEGNFFMGTKIQLLLILFETMMLLIQ